MSCMRVKGFGILTISGTFKPGDPCPDGYIDREEWAMVQLKAGLKQQECGCCCRWFFPQELSGVTIETPGVMIVKKTKRNVGVVQKVTLKSPVCKACQAKRDSKVKGIKV